MIERERCEVDSICDSFDPGECISHDIFTSRNVPNVGGELTNEISVAKLTKRTFIRLLNKCKRERLVARVDGKISFFDHVTKIFDSFVDGQQFSIVGSIVAFRVRELFRKET